MRYIETLKDGERISEVYLCKSKSIALTKTGKEYANVMLADKTGQIDSKIWDLNSGGIAEFDVNDYVAVTGQVTSYNGALQFKIERARIASENEYVAADYVPSSRYNIDNMFAELMKYVDSVKSTYMKQLLYSFFKDETFAKKFKCVSAAKTVHHGFAGGLLEHSLSVTRLCAKMSENYDFLNRDLLISCAMLHDVGKIGIPESVLKKPGKLTDEEWEIMKQHPVIGAEKVLEPNEALRDLIPIVKYHHERLDGKGYPEHLKGNEIPLAARIVSVADAYHALVSDRPYRKGMPIEKACAILKEGAGTQWDADLVRQFISIAPSLTAHV